MATPYQLLDLATELAEVVKSIDAITAKQRSPYDNDTSNLSNIACLLAAQAKIIRQAGVSSLSIDVQHAIGKLTSQVAAANSSLLSVSDAWRALSVVGAVITVALTVTSNITTGNWIGTTDALTTLTNNLQATLSAS